MEQFPLLMAEQNKEKIVRAFLISHFSAPLVPVRHRACGKTAFKGWRLLV
jgi:hypothetical protein